MFLFVDGISEDYMYNSCITTTYTQKLEDSKQYAMKACMS